MVEQSFMAYGEERLKKGERTVVVFSKEMGNLRVPRMSKCRLIAHIYLLMVLHAALIWANALPKGGR